MARLNDIEIRESEVSYTNKREWFFHPSGHHVRELMLHFLPKDYVLDGSSKLSVIFGEKPPSEELCSTILGVTVYRIVGFDVEAYMKKTIEEQQEIILTHITNAMVAIATAVGGDTEIIYRATDAVRENNFATEIEVTKLSRSTKDKKFRIQVFRCLGPAVGEIWEARICNRENVVVSVAPITKNPDHLNRVDHFSKSRWSGDTFQIVCGRLDKVEYALNVGALIKEAGLC